MMVRIRVPGLPAGTMNLAEALCQVNYMAAHPAPKLKAKRIRAKSVPGASKSNKQLTREYRLRHPGAGVEYNKKWKQEHPKAMIGYVKKHQAMVRAMVGFRRLFGDDNLDPLSSGRCHVCGSIVNVHQRNKLPICNICEWKEARAKMMGAEA